MKKWIALAALAAVGLLLGGHARAGFSVTFGAPNDGLAKSSTPSPYATLSVTGNSDGTITLAVSNLNPDTSGLGEVGFNIDQRAHAGLNVLSSVGTGDWALDLSPNGSLDGFGKFLEVFGAPNNDAKDRLDSYSITLDDAKHDLADALASNPGGLFGSNSRADNGGSWQFAMEVFPDDGNTGFAGPGVTAVPEPASLALLASGVLTGGLVWLRRRFVT